MSKAKFLKQAKEKYQHMIDTAKGVTWKQEMNFIFSEKEILRVWWNVEYSAMNHRWCTVETLPMQSDEKLFEKIGLFISNEEEEYPAIIKALRRELPICPNDLIDNILFDEEDEDKTINPIQELEFSLNVKKFCEMIGLKA